MMHLPARCQVMLRHELLDEVLELSAMPGAARGSAVPPLTAVIVSGMTDGQLRGLAGVIHARLEPRTESGGPGV